jgi:hypothetical protein
MENDDAGDHLVGDPMTATRPKAAQPTMPTRLNTAPLATSTRPISAALATNAGMAR